jgi:hypothetical protein
MVSLRARFLRLFCRVSLAALVWALAAPAGFS